MGGVRVSALMKMDVAYAPRLSLGDGRVGPRPDPLPPLPNFVFDYLLSAKELCQQLSSHSDQAKSMG